MRKKKRSAGQRRFLALKRKTDSVKAHLRTLQCSMHEADGNGKQIRQLIIIQKITEAIERLETGNL